MLYQIVHKICVQSAQTHTVKAAEVGKFHLII